MSALVVSLLMAITATWLFNQSTQALCKERTKVFDPVDKTVPTFVGRDFLSAAKRRKKPMARYVKIKNSVYKYKCC